MYSVYSVTVSCKFCSAMPEWGPTLMPTLDGSALFNCY